MRTKRFKRPVRPFFSDVTQNQKFFLSQLTNKHKKARVKPIPEYVQGADREILPDGDYKFVVVDAGEKEAASGNPMIELQLDCFDTDPDKPVRVIDRLVFTSNSYWKIDAFRRATGEKIAENQKVSFESEDCIDRRGRCSLRTTSYEGRNRNEVAFYIDTDQDQATAKTTPQPAAKGTVPKSNQPF